MSSVMLTNARLSWQVFTRLVLGTSRVWVFFGTFVVMLFVLQWLFNIDQLSQIVLGDSGLSFNNRATFLVEGFINIFRYGNNFIPLSMILIALLQAVSITLLLSYRDVVGLRAHQSLPLGLSFLGVGCVACGGSVLTPILGVVAANVSIGFAESLSILLLLLAIVISYISMNRISFYVARMVAE